MQSALLLAAKGHHVHVVENGPAIGGFFPLLDRQFPTNSCGVCFMSPSPPAYCPIYESEFHENIDILTSCDLRQVSRENGSFRISLEERPRCVDIDKCDLCGICAEVCPVEVDSELGGGIERRKAIYLPFPQAIPRSFLVDGVACTKCGKCQEACPSKAISLDAAPTTRQLDAGAIVVGFGFEPFQGENKGEYGLGRYRNVLSSVQYERMLSCSSATDGVPVRPSDGKRPENVAFIQCVGSRDVACGQPYCSSVCCMYATKQAMLSVERDRGIKPTIFYMDIRTVGKDYERYCEKAKRDYGVRYVRSAISTLREFQRSKRLLIRYGLENGELSDEEFDLVVLSLGFTPPASVTLAAQQLGIELNEYGFCQTEEFNPTQTSVPGVFVAGAFREPADIPDTVVQASSAAADVSAYLKDSPPQPLGATAGGQAPAANSDAGKTGGEAVEDTPRVGVFLCDSKGMLAAGLELGEIIDELNARPELSCVEQVDVTALGRGVTQIARTISENRLGRIVLAGHRSPALSKALRQRSHEVASGECLVFWANIGEQCANVHPGAKPIATEKAKVLLRAEVRRAELAQARTLGSKPLQSRVLVLGGGVAGLVSSLSLADQGVDVTLVEKTDQLGGHARSIHYTLRGSDSQAMLTELISEVEKHDRTQVLKSSELREFGGTWGNYRALVATDGDAREILHGAVIVATGAKAVETDEYLYGKSPSVIRQSTLEEMIATGDPAAGAAQTVVMIQCVGSRDADRPDCSRVCCGQAVKNALKLKEMDPGTNVYVLNRDIRTCGFSEKYYYDARDRGVIFVRYESDRKPEVTDRDGGVRIVFFDSAAGQDVTVDADLLVLSTGIEPSEETRTLAETLGIEVGEDGFFAEANPKSAPLDSVDRGKYFCGLCHSPAHIRDAICQGKAAAARASALLWSGVGEFTQNPAFVNERACSGCGLCVTACPYQARVLDEVSSKAQVLEDLCKGCGTCVTACPNAASQQRDFERGTVLDVLAELLA